MLTQSQLETLRAAVDRIIPADGASDDSPSGWEAGVGDYLARLLTLEPGFLFEYGKGLDALDAEALAATRKAFSELDAKSQDTLLKKIEAGKAQTTWPLPPKDFFRRLVQHTMEGYYADPGNGGNKDAVSWRMIGYQVTA